MKLHLSRRTIGRLFILLGAAIGIMGAVGWLNHQSVLYRSRAAIIVGPLEGEPTADENALRRRYAETYLELLKRPAVLQATLDALHSSLSPDALAGLISVNLISDTQLLEILVTSPNAVEAQAFADELARQVITLSQRTSSVADTEFLQKQITDLQTRLTLMRTDLEGLTAQIANAINLTTLQELRTRRSDLVFQVTLLEQNYTALSAQLEKARHGVSVAVLAGVASPPIPITVVPSAGLLIVTGLSGALLGGLAGWLLQSIDRTFSSARSAQESLGIPALAAIPVIRAPREDDKLIHRQPENSYYVEPYHAIRNALNGGEVASKVVLITSAQADEGKSLTTANLGIALAQAGRQVLIVDANLRSPMQHKLFKLSNRDGLTALVYAFAANGNDDSRLSRLKRIDALHLSVLSSGPLPLEPAEIVESTQFVGLMQSLAEQFDHILIDAPALSGAPELLTLAPYVDGVLLVIGARRTRRRAVTLAVQQLQQANATLIGAVLNRAPVPARAAPIKDRAARSNARQARLAEASAALDSSGQTERVG